MTSPDMDPDARESVAVAVQRALAQHGYERLTTAKIAEEYENSEAGLYYYFDTKDEMIAAFLDRAADYLSEDLLGVDADDPEAALRDACDFLFRTPEHDYAGIAVAIMELLSHAPYNETLRAPLLELETACLDALTDIVAAGVEQGVFRPVEPRATAAFLLAAADGSTGMAVALEMDVNDDLRQGWTAYVDSLVAEPTD
ncbi:TetR/AcrR family transcriptional regulator [Haloarcula salinisoli]|uniref:TetR/AcrR family transcriptional regulator n=1 Tax=Haloarcula salinisoli TaxID=2487746 RepID=A0A8J8C7V9_9EURY|nr:TetR/AcrR family transcriptional regulator [Halomicroarcula salinisoli]MBX0284781.1 TetR/AcrR family transcriptional regulator [Halomicroarcula salinisoli]MBX0303761.1 TetR/AcrR family transcriptional regulator [Halomicroarcula salinisoli]